MTERREIDDEDLSRKAFSASKSSAAQYGSVPTGMVLEDLGLSI